MHEYIKWYLWMVGFLNSILIVKSVLLFFKSEVFTIFLVNVGAEWRKPRELNLLRRGVKQRRTTHEWRTTCFFPHQVASVFLSQCWSWSDWAPAQINHSFTFFHNLQGVCFKWDHPISVPKRKPPSSQSQHRFYWNSSCDWLIRCFTFGTEIEGSHLKKTPCTFSPERHRDSVRA